MDTTQQPHTTKLGPCVCRQYVQVKTGQDLPREGLDAALDEVLANYKTELGLSDKEGDQLEHLQVSNTNPSCLFLRALLLNLWPWKTSNHTGQATLLDKQAYWTHHRQP